MKLGVVSPDREFRRIVPALCPGWELIYPTGTVGGLGLARSDADVLLLHALDAEELATVASRVLPATSLVVCACRAEDFTPLWARESGLALLTTVPEADRLELVLKAAAMGLTVLDEDARVSADVPRPTTESGLSVREHEVLAELAAGRSNREIADVLGISENTVKFHLASIYGKLGVAGRAEAVYAGVRNGILAV